MNQMNPTVKNPLTFRMYMTIQFNRPVDTEHDYLSPGGYQMTMNDTPVAFDFEDTNIQIRNDDKRFVDFECKNPDYDNFPDLLDFTQKMLNSVESIDEIFIFTGEHWETDLTPVAVTELIFVLSYDDWLKFPVSKSVLETANVWSNV